ncbi:hypothetical protein [Paracoccus sp. DMF]|uniref:hypothetical protein n=1 Tax=Paracoccus sp. DMF TaxID=400837 RepID=UPI0021E4688F|nr:hypothetical protein [Paracoccus sp. DMF]
MESKAPDPAPVGARKAFRGVAGTGLPAMPESPIPDLAPRNRTPDPAHRHARPEPVEG